MKYSLIVNQNQTLSNQERLNQNIENHFFIKLLKILAKSTGKRNSLLYQLLIFSKFKNFLRYITLTVIYSDFGDLTEIEKKPKDNYIYNSFINLALVLDIVYENDKTFSLNKKYFLTRDEQKLFLKRALGGNKVLNKVIIDYKYLCSFLDEDLSFLKKEIKDEFIYIKKLITYMLEIYRIDFKRQVSPSFTEDFYTDLGELAFNTFTKKNFIHFIKNKKINNVLDIGCGNGNYIDLFLDFNSNIQLIGVERQEKVYEKLGQKYKGKNNITLINKDITKINFENKFDMINMSYMLFYLTDEERDLLFKKLKTILSSNGIIVICQYYPNFERYQEIIAKYYRKWSLVSQYKYSICNSILYSEVLLNNMLNDFSKAEEWDLFLELLDNNGLVVTDIVPADDTFYSYFITVKHRNEV
ncbi:class I SAM-dependent methyltransferase [Bacillus atrophaeus]|uniref:class I SAM-dependent methyltransferase n=1 Tax=Bacillus atrophaeus TaxID=1452 RepID=UPI0022812E60|nr:class I SAM-dependent methyltransferase [Bacillus atrophaeus]MCY9162078.1 class I SAM-dependent methyltransferase [Bacillus atrophaeus]